ncbi:hypothetical protein KKC32_03330 [Patescibacteria group bacterium]|nr:hypothetical protein [Patescibacteria group bacterium]
MTEEQRFASAELEERLKRAILESFPSGTVREDWAEDFLRRPPLLQSRLADLLTGTSEFARLCASLVDTTVYCEIRERSFPRYEADAYDPIDRLIPYEFSSSISFCEAQTFFNEREYGSVGIRRAMRYAAANPNSYADHLLFLPGACFSLHCCDWVPFFVTYDNGKRGFTVTMTTPRPAGFDGLYDSKYHWLVEKPR